MSLPLTGAVFDMFVDVFQQLLLQDGLISRDLDAMSRPEIRATDEATVQAEFDRAYAGRMTVSRVRCWMRAITLPLPGSRVAIAVLGRELRAGSCRFARCRSTDLGVRGPRDHP